MRGHKPLQGYSMQAPGSLLVAECAKLRHGIRILAFHRDPDRITSWHLKCPYELLLWWSGFHAKVQSADPEVQ